MLIVLFPLRMHVIPDSTMFRSYIIIYGICLFFGGIISYFQFNVILKINTPFDNLLYCNFSLYSDLLNNYYSVTIILLSLFNYFIIFCKIIWSSYGKKYFKPKNQISPNNDRPEKDIKAIVKNSFRILRSVLIISLILIFGWLISSIGRNNIMVLMNIIIFSITNLFIPKSNQQFSIINGNITNLTVSIITCIYIITAGINALRIQKCI
uniref:G_PROTEIN_RECEP_F1_2 domain-containing protein n=1 Tax=Meloidogyne incognita TaxID=6306 RepID=A0A914M432_MELIC